MTCLNIDYCFTVLLLHTCSLRVVLCSCSFVFITHIRSVVLKEKLSSKLVTIVAYKALGHVLTCSNINYFFIVPLLHTCSLRVVLCSCSFVFITHIRSVVLKEKLSSKLVTIVAYKALGHVLTCSNINYFFIVPLLHTCSLRVVLCSCSFVFITRIRPVVLKEKLSSRLVTIVAWFAFSCQNTNTSGKTGLLWGCSKVSDV